LVVGGDSDTLSFERNVVVGGEGVVTHFSGTDGIDVDFFNNIVTRHRGGYLVSGSHSSLVDVEIRNNTIADGEVVEPGSSYHYGIFNFGTQGDLTVSSNIISTMTSDYVWVGRVCAVEWSNNCDYSSGSYPTQEEEGWPDSFVYNVIYDAHESWAGVVLLDGMVDSELVSTSESDNLVSSSFYTDPSFTEGAAGSYTLDSTSPAIDAGDPDTQYSDPDGSNNDVGAFGGPNGDWWMEVSWLP